ncbi:hypothetical protein A2154_04050 [Candidatus Gottesmanbacteria bacterium RBG_16_43_7]|uniref:Galactose-1-phosphate uridyl transferase N-terminal domain-containing protein n=1 Tax=Candidatus Gottesmanbacteria bacterium RBG_16_43_7 TaxID=1798373 RepID=A0A1F5ZAZ4_9BACT|nr:MAG: hypothetical protein A2154_04050 [Candidatus Gottesmanbacteria bacterium RBG_16_43_7]
MAKYVPDIKTQRWVIISQTRVSRPHTQLKTQTKASVCPFCYNCEKMTPPEVHRLGGGEKDHPGWLVRVVPNKFPITDVHEVIIHSPDHKHDLEDLDGEQVKHVFTVYRDRYITHEKDGHVLIFCNHGLHAGASLMHPHSQLVVVPRQINLDSLSREPVNNIISDSADFITYCPDFSQWPYEVWLSPKNGSGKFSAISDDDLTSMARIFQRSLKQIKSVLTDPNQPFKQANEPFVYNYYIYHGENWFLRIIPRAVHRAGFELGTGLNVNVVDPANAAETLKSTSV